MNNGHTTDGKDGDCYGWELAGECKDQSHADTCAFLALAIFIRYKTGYIPQEDGGVMYMMPELEDAPLLAGDLP